MPRPVRSAIVGASLTLLTLAGPASSAVAEVTPPTCDQAALDAAVATATAQVRAAQHAYTTNTKTSMQTLVAQLKSREIRQAEAADHRADALERKATRATGKAAKEARTAAHRARAQARAAAKEAARIRRASRAQLVAKVKVERAALKAAWNAAKAALADAKAAAEECAGQSSTEDTGTGEDTTTSPDA